MLRGKGAAGMTFQVLFKCYGLFAKTKGHSSLNLLWTVPGSVGNLAGVVSLQTGFKIVCESGIVTGFVGFAGEDINVMKGVVH